MSGLKKLLLGVCSFVMAGAMTFGFAACDDEGETESSNDGGVVASNVVSDGVISGGNTTSASTAVDSSTNSSAADSTNSSSNSGTNSSSSGTNGKSVCVDCNKMSASLVERAEYGNALLCDDCFIDKLCGVYKFSWFTDGENTFRIGETYNGYAITEDTWEVIVRDDRAVEFLELGKWFWEPMPWIIDGGAFGLNDELIAPFKDADLVLKVSVSGDELIYQIDDNQFYLIKSDESIPSPKCYKCDEGNVGTYYLEYLAYVCDDCYDRLSNSNSSSNNSSSSSSSSSDRDDSSSDWQDSSSNWNDSSSNGQDSSSTVVPDSSSDDSSSDWGDVATEFLGVYKMNSLVVTNSKGETMQYNLGDEVQVGADEYQELTEDFLWIVIRDDGFVEIDGLLLAWNTNANDVTEFTASTVMDGQKMRVFFADAETVCFEVSEKEDVVRYYCRKDAKESIPAATCYFCGKTNDVQACEMQAGLYVYVCDACQGGTNPPEPMTFCNGCGYSFYMSEMAMVWAENPGYYCKDCLESCFNVEEMSKCSYCYAFCAPGYIWVSEKYGMICDACYEKMENGENPDNPDVMKTFYCTGCKMEYPMSMVQWIDNSPYCTNCANSNRCEKCGNWVSYELNWTEEGYLCNECYFGGETQITLCGYCKKMEGVYWVDEWGCWFCDGCYEAYVNGGAYICNGCYEAQGTQNVDGMWYCDDCYNAHYGDRLCVCCRENSWWKYEPGFGYLCESCYKQLVGGETPPEIPDGWYCDKCYGCFDYELSYVDGLGYLCQKCYEEAMGGLGIVSCSLCGSLADFWSDEFGYVCKECYDKQMNCSQCGAHANQFVEGVGYCEDCYQRIFGSYRSCCGCWSDFVEADGTYYNGDFYCWGCYEAYVNGGALVRCCARCNGGYNEKDMIQLETGEWICFNCYDGEPPVEMFICDSCRCEVDSTSIISTEWGFFCAECYEWIWPEIGQVICVICNERACERWSYEYGFTCNDCYHNAGVEVPEVPKINFYGTYEVVWKEDYTVEDGGREFYSGMTLIIRRDGFSELVGYGVGQNYIYDDWMQIDFTNLDPMEKIVAEYIDGEVQVWFDGDKGRVAYGFTYCGDYYAEPTCHACGTEENVYCRLDYEHSVPFYVCDECFFAYIECCGSCGEETVYDFYASTGAVCYDCYCRLWDENHGVESPKYYCYHCDEIYGEESGTYYNGDFYCWGCYEAYVNGGAAGIPCDKCGTYYFPEEGDCPNCGDIFGDEVGA